MFGVCFFFPVLNDGGPERLHVKGQAVPVWRQLIKTRCVAAALQFEVSCPQFMVSFITAVCGENVVFFFFFFFLWGGPGEQISQLSPAVPPLNKPNYNKPLLFFFFFLPQTSSDVTGAGFLSWNLGHFWYRLPVLGNGASLGVVGLFSCATLRSQPQTYKEHCFNVELHWICENDGNYQNAGAGE